MSNSLRQAAAGGHNEMMTETTSSALIVTFAGSGEAFGSGGRY
jgi:hypothetical protein